MSKDNNNSDNITVLKEIKNYSKEPVFKKKAEEAAKFLKKNGLSESFKKKSK
ncbi:MAG: hypothetical protein ABUT20_33175 [Bacteroidota bacterium]